MRRVSKSAYAPVLTKGPATLREAADLLIGRFERVTGAPPRIRAPCLAAVLVLSSNTIATAQQIRTYGLFGYGETNCARWLSTPQEKMRGRLWIYGFWTGVNAAGMEQTAASTDVIGEVEKICRNEPSEKLARAVLRVHARLRSLGK